MRFMRVLGRFILLLCLAATVAMGAQEANLPADGSGGESDGTVPARELVQARGAVVVCEGMIDDGLFQSIRRRAESAIAGGAGYLVFEISTYGGAVEAADDIAKYLILDLGKRVRTVAYVSTEAISAGALISVSCQDIVMLANTTIGACAPIALGAELKGVEREKVESFIRAAFMRAAEANGYPEALLKAMVTMQIEVYRVRNTTTGQWEFFEGDGLPRDPNTYDLENKELICADDEILTLTASQAKEHGVARAVVAGRDEVFAFLADRDGVEFVGEPAVLRTTWSEEMVRWLNSPVVMSVLVMVALLGVYLELSTPGVGLPGLAAVVCLAVIIGSKYLHGLANWVEVAVLLVGIVLLLVEVFVLPGFGIAGTLGIACILAGLLGMLVKNAPGELPIPRGPEDWNVFAAGVLSLAAGFAGFVVLAMLSARFLPRMRLFSGLLLTAGASAGASEATGQSVGGSDLKVGDRGVVVSTLRPVGRARFADRLADVVARAGIVEKGTAVEVDEIHGNRVVVKVAKVKQDT
ncbi:MAG TPA: hypothetical protein ENN81_10020 [Phycisphaerales bacterium]|nr:hypothetical protein [Phycisphaerales bacterium]